MNSAPISPVVEHNTCSSIDFFIQNNNLILHLIQGKIEKLHNLTINTDELSKILYYYESVLHESNLNEYVVYCTEMCNNQIFPLM